MNPWLLVAGDFTPLGGMDRANYALAAHLAANHADVHLVTHRAWPDLASQPTVVTHHVPRPFGSHVLGSPLLARAGSHWARRLNRQRALVCVNGGNCDAGQVNWIHYLHAAHAPLPAAGWRQRAKTWANHRYFLRRERTALGRARVIICNSRRTARDVVERIGVSQARVEVVYYGTDPGVFAPVSSAERAEARRSLGWRDRPVALFIGALGDRRKGFDTLFTAWCSLCADPSWDCSLAIAGSGADLSFWKQHAEAAGLSDRIIFLGFRSDIDKLIAATDLVVHPARYEAYGLGVHESLCRGIPAIVSASAGVAERYPEELSGLLLNDPDNADELVERLRLWRKDAADLRQRTEKLGAALRTYTWDDMARRIVDVANAA